MHSWVGCLDTSMVKKCTAVAVAVATAAAAAAAAVVVVAAVVGGDGSESFSLKWSHERPTAKCGQKKKTHPSARCGSATVATRRAQPSKHR